MRILTLARRHRVVTALIVMFLLVVGTVGGVIGAWRAEPTYQSDGIVLIIPPGAGNPSATMNPFVNLDQNMSQLAQALSTRMAAPDVVERIHQQAPSVVNYQAQVRYDQSVVNPAPTSQLQFTVQGTDAQATRDVVAQLMVLADEELSRIQTHAGVTQSTLADAVVLVQPTEPQVMPVSSLRAAGMAAVAAVLLGLVLIVVGLGVWRFVRGRHGETMVGTVDDSDDTDNGKYEPPGGSANHEPGHDDSGTSSSDSDGAQNDSVTGDGATDETREPQTWAPSTASARHTAPATEARGSAW